MKNPSLRVVVLVVLSGAALSFAAPAPSGPVEELRSVLQKATMSAADRGRATALLDELAVRVAAPAGSSASLPTPQGLGVKEHAALRKDMVQHASSMRDLWTAIIRLDRPRVREIALQNASRADGIATSTSATLLPERFQASERELRSLSESLAEVATGEDETALVRSYGQLMEVCVRCHAANQEEAWGTR
jgi:hypothetical protein